MSRPVCHALPRRCGLGLCLAASLLAAAVEGTTHDLYNPEWSIRVWPEGYSDIALDQRPNFSFREYLSGEWGTAVGYTRGETVLSPTWLCPDWIYPSWTTNSNFQVLQPLQPTPDSPNGDGFEVVDSVIGNPDLEITIRNEMVNPGGVAQGMVPAGDPGPGDHLLSSPCAFRQTFRIKNVSGTPLTGVRFFKFLHGFQSTKCLYDDRDYGGPLGEFRYDITQQGTDSRMGDNGYRYKHIDTITLHAQRAPSAVECGYYGSSLVDGHENDDGKPSVGVHWSVEADSLDGTDFFAPPEGKWACLFMYYPRWLKGDTVHITPENYGCGGVGTYLCDVTTRPRDEMIDFLYRQEGLKANAELMGRWIDGTRNMK